MPYGTTQTNTEGSDDMGVGLKKLITAEEMANMVNPPSKMSLNDIGKKYGVSRQRVHQVLQEYKEQFPELFVGNVEPTKEEIKEKLDKNYSLSDIAKDFEISTGHLKKKMDEYGLKKQFIKDVLTKEILIELYVNKEKSDDEIANMYNCSANTVMKLRYNHNIHESMKRTLGEKLTRDIFIDLYINKKLLLVQLAELFGTNIQNVIKLKKEYKIDELVKEKRNMQDERDIKFRATGVSAEELKVIKEFLIQREVI